MDQWISFEESVKVFFVYFFSHIIFISCILLRPLAKSIFSHITTNNDLLYRSPHVYE